MYEGEKIRKSGFLFTEALAVLGGQEHRGSAWTFTDRTLRIDREWDSDKERIEDRVDYDEDRVENRFDYDRDRVEDRVRYDEDRVEDFPEDAARWGGRKVQEVEDVPDDIRHDYDDVKDDVEDIPEEVAGWGGRKVGEVERFDDRVDDAYEAGRDEQRYDDDRY